MRPLGTVLAPSDWIACLHCFVNQESESISVHTYSCFRKRGFLPHKLHIKNIWHLLQNMMELVWQVEYRRCLFTAISLESWIGRVNRNDATARQQNYLCTFSLATSFSLNKSNELSKSCMHPLLILSQLTKLYSPQFPSSSGSMSKLSNHWLSSQTLLWHSYFSSFKSKSTSKLLW